MYINVLGWQYFTWKNLKFFICSVPPTLNVHFGIKWFFGKFYLICFIWIICATSKFLIEHWFCISFVLSIRICWLCIICLYYLVFYSTTVMIIIFLWKFFYIISIPIVSCKLCRYTSCIVHTLRPYAHTLKKS